MELTQKNKRKIIIHSVLLLVVVAIVFGWLQKRVIHDDADLQMTVYPHIIKAGESIHFTDRTPFATQHRWDFGDGGGSVSDSGDYCYTRPGYYPVQLIVNDHYTRMVTVHVQERLVVATLADSLVSIDAPQTGIQGEQIVFRCTALDATDFRWKFGETGGVDSKKAMEIYTYQKPGDYTVLLYTNTTLNPVEHHIRIFPAFNKVNDSISFDDTYAKIDNDFKRHLQEIANGNNVEDNYNYLLHKYIHENEIIPVKINGSLVNDFHNYCFGLQFNKNTTIQNVKCGFGDKQKSVTKIEVQQSE